MAMMSRRINGLAAVTRALTAAPSSRATPHPHRLHDQAAASSNNNDSSSSSYMWTNFLTRDRLVQSSRSSAAHGVAGVVFFSAAASSLAEEVYAKEPIQSSNFSPKEVVLYQYEACPFCNKVKAFLDYHDIPYKIVEVNPLSKKEIKWSDYKKVPILMVDGEQMVDSSAIIDKLSEKIRSDLPDDRLPDITEEKDWRGWVDNHLVHVLSPNIYRSPSEALESFDYITSHGNFSFFEKISGRYVGAAAMYFVSKKLKKKYNIVDERATLYAAAEKWVDALKGREFLGGGKPNLADLAVFGVLRPIRHLQSGKDMVQNTQIGDWYSRMEKVVGAPSGIPA